MITRNSRGTKRFTATAAAVAVVASSLAISGSASAVVGVTTDRIGGDNRYETAGLIADEAFTAPVADILLASGLAFPDALAGNALAGTIDGPILLTDPDSLSPDAAASIQALSDADTTVHILGETAAVSAAVEAEVAALGVATNRFGGSDRFETAAEIAEFVDANATIPGLNETKTVIVATGMNFPDALAGGPLAYVGPHPILLVRTDSVPAATAAAITNIGADEVIILGGESAVSAAVATELEALTGNPAVRLAGDNRWGTAAEVADAALASFGFPGDEVLLANGLKFADALAGGPLGGEMQAPIVLTRESALPADTAAWLTANNDVVANITALGGPAAIDEATLASAAAAAELPAPTTNQSFAITAEGSTILQLSDAATYPADQGDEIIFSVSGLTPGDDYDLALVTTGGEFRDNSIMADGEFLSFRDQDLDDVADDIGTTYDNDIFISAYGTAFNFTNTAGAGTRTVDGATADANGELRVVIEADDAGDSAHLVVWNDANGNNDLDLDAASTDSWNMPAEGFGVSDEIVYHFGEAPSGYDDCCEEIVYIDKDAQFFVTEGGYFFNYDSTDSYEYAENDFSISFAEAQQALSVGDSMDIYNDVHDFYSRTGPSGFDFEEPDTPGTPINATAVVGNFDGDADADDVQVSWNAPMPMDALISQYEVFRVDATNLASEISVGTTTFDPNYSNVATTLVDEDVPAGEWLYRVAAISRTSADGDKSLLSSSVTVEGPTGPTITSAALTTDTIVLGAIDEFDVWTLVFSGNLDAVDDGDQVWVTDVDGDLIRLEHDTDATVGAGNTAATFVITDDTLVITLNATPTDIDVAGDGNFVYPATVVATAGVTAVAVEADVASSADVTID